MNSHMSVMRRQAGFTVVELMIALVLGLIVIAAAFNIYVGGSSSARFTAGLQSMQENGRYSMTVLQRDLRLAGFSPEEKIDPFDFSGGDADALVIRTMQPYDCNGASTVPTAGLAVNTYKLDATEEELTCQGNQTDSFAMTVVENVEAFSVLYGVDTDGDPKTFEPQRYVPYSASLVPSDVVALRFALLVTSGEPIRSRDRSETYVLLNNEVTSTADRLAREVFSSTVLIRNKLL